MAKLQLIATLCMFCLSQAFQDNKIIKECTLGDVKMVGCARCFCVRLPERLAYVCSRKNCNDVDKEEKHSKIVPNEEVRTRIQLANLYKHVE